MKSLGTPSARWFALIFTRLFAIELQSVCLVLNWSTAWIIRQWFIYRMIWAECAVSGTLLHLLAAVSSYLAGRALQVRKSQMLSKGCVHSVLGLEFRMRFTLLVQDFTLGVSNLVLRRGICEGTYYDDCMFIIFSCAGTYYDDLHVYNLSTAQWTQVLTFIFWIPNDVVPYCFCAAWNCWRFAWSKVRNVGRCQVLFLVDDKLALNRSFAGAAASLLQMYVFGGYDGSGIHV